MGFIHYKVRRLGLPSGSSVHLSFPHDVKQRKQRGQGISRCGGGMSEQRGRVMFSGQHKAWSPELPASQVDAEKT